MVLCHLDSWATELGFRFPQLRETSEKLLVLQLSERVLDLIRAPLVVRDRLNKLVKPYLICSNADHITVSQIRSCVWKVAERLGPPAPDLGYMWWSWKVETHTDVDSDEATWLSTQLWPWKNTLVYKLDRLRTGTTTSLALATGSI